MHALIIARIEETTMNAAAAVAAAETEIGEVSGRPLPLPAEASVPTNEGIERDTARYRDMLLQGEGDTTVPLSLRPMRNDAKQLILLGMKGTYPSLSQPELRVRKPNSLPQAKRRRWVAIHRIPKKYFSFLFAACCTHL